MIEIDDTNIGWIVHDKSKSHFPMTWSTAYKVCFTKEDLTRWLEHRGWDFKGIGGLEISDTPGIASMQGCGDFEIIVVPFELYTKGM